MAQLADCEIEGGRRQTGLWAPHRPVSGLSHGCRTAGSQLDCGAGVALAQQLKAEGQLGAVVIIDLGTHGPVDEAGRVEIGYGLAAPSRGRGYGSEAVAAVTEWLLSQPGVRQVRAHTLTDNMPSRRVLEKAAFTHIGLDEGEALYQRD